MAGNCGEIADLNPPPPHSAISHLCPVAEQPHLDTFLCSNPLSALPRGILGDVLAVGGAEECLGVGEVVAVGPSVHSPSLTAGVH